MRRVVALSLVGIGIVALATAAFIPFSTWSMAGADSIPVMVAATDLEHEAKVPESVNDFYPVISEQWGQNPTVNDEEEASKAVGFTVKFPRIEPDYKLQLAATDHLESGNSYVWLFYSKNPIAADDMTINQFWDQGGITINYHENMTRVLGDDGTISTSYTDMTAMLEFSKESGLDAAGGDINGHAMVAMAGQHREFQGFAIHDPAQVDFIAGNTHVSLQGYKDTEELIRIAETMPFDAEHEPH